MDRLAACDFHGLAQQDIIQFGRIPDHSLCHAALPSVSDCAHRIGCSFFLFYIYSGILCLVQSLPLVSILFVDHIAVRSVHFADDKLDRSVRHSVSGHTLRSRDRKDLHGSAFAFPSVGIHRCHTHGHAVFRPQLRHVRRFIEIFCIPDVFRYERIIRRVIHRLIYPVADRVPALAPCQGHTAFCAFRPQLCRSLGIPDHRDA